MRVAFYRCLYGEDFIVESIRSILRHVDRVIVFKAERPWGTSEGVQYQGEWVPWPDKFDELRERVIGMREDKIEIVDHWYPTPFGQYDHIVNNLLIPGFGDDLKDILVMEPDWVFSEEEAGKFFSAWDAAPDLGSASASQIELWRTCDWRVPEREARPTPELHRRRGVRGPLNFGGAVYNLGFCMSEKVMRWKHLTALAFAKEIKDCAPAKNWFEDKWRTWDPTDNNRDLEPTETLEFKIPMAVRYDSSKVPSAIRAAVTRVRSGDS